MAAACTYFLANNLINGQGMSSVNIGLTLGIVLAGLLIELSLFASFTNIKSKEDLGEKIVNNIAASLGFGVISIEGFKFGIKKHQIKSAYTSI